MNYSQTLRTDVNVPLRTEYSAVFPLTLAPFERFLLQDERADYPMVFYVEMVFLGRMNRDALLQSLQEAASRHPLLLARVESNRQGMQWVLPEQASLPVDFQDAASDYTPPRGEYIDLRRESGLRIWIREDDQRTSITLQLHHSCCDGEGSRHFGFDFMTGYAQRTGEAGGPEWTRVEYERLKERANYQPPVVDQKPATTTLSQKIRDAYHFLVLGPSPLASPEIKPQARNESAPRPLMIKHVFTREETVQIEERAAELEQSVNDIAISLLFQTIASWNRKHGRLSKRQRIRILMPMDLRERADRWLTAANRIGFSFLSRSMEQCGDWAALIDGVGEEIKYIRKIRLGLDFLQVMAAVQRIPYLLPVMLRLPRCMATAVLTNMGDTTRRFRSRFPIREHYPIIGNVRLEQVVGVPPLRKGTSSGFGICVCAGYMAVSIRGDYLRLTKEDSEALLQDYISAWKQWMGAPQTLEPQPLVATPS